MMVDFIAKRIHLRSFYAWVARTTLNEEKKGSGLFESDWAPSEYKDIVGFHMTSLKFLNYKTIDTTEILLSWCIREAEN